MLEAYDGGQRRTALCCIGRGLLYPQYGGGLCAWRSRSGILRQVPQDRLFIYDTLNDAWLQAEVGAGTYHFLSLEIHYLLLV